MRANAVLRATKAYVCRQRPPSPTILQSRSLEKIYDVVNRITARTRQHTLYRGARTQMEKVRLEQNEQFVTYNHFMVAIPIALTLWRQ